MDRDANDLADLLVLLGRGPAGILEETSPCDGMLGPKGPGHYRRVGLSALRCIRLSLLAAGRTSVDSILDLPCGHGRVLRVLARAFPGAALTACDLDQDAVDFCARVFHATPVLASEDPSRIKLNTRFDLVWCGSLLTHLDADKWPGFLRLFESVLEPGGVLAVTTHGRVSVDSIRSGGKTYGLDEGALATLMEGWEQEGFGYVGYPAQPGYGISLSSPWWVCREISRFESLRVVLYSESAWDRHQDVVACVRL